MTRDGRHECALCGVAYRSRGSALQCCGDRFDDLEDGSAPSEPQCELAADSGATVERACPVCAGDGCRTCEGYGYVLITATGGDQP